jgi:sulfide dehydrogenase cytochrome subunit
MIRGPWLILSAVLCAGTVRHARAAEPHEPDAPVAALSASAVASLAAGCAGCHGTRGHVVKGSKVPGIAGLSQDYFVRQMRAYVAGTIPSTIMQQIAKGYDERETAALAAYFAAQR